MPIYHEWVIPDRLTYMELSGHINDEDLLVIVEFANDLMETYDREDQVHCIIDMSQVDKVPSLREIIEHFKTIRYRYLDGWSLFVVNEYSLATHAVRALAQLFGFKFRIMRSNAEAFAFLETVSPHLYPLELPIETVA